MLDEAAEAAAKGEHALALKLVHRALEAGFMNARVHVDAALLLHRLGRTVEAVAVGRRAVDLAPAAGFVRERLRAAGLHAALPEPEPPRGAPPRDPDDAAVRTARSAAFDPGEARAALEQQGVAVLPGWLTASECRALADLPPSSEAFAAERALATARGTLHWAAFGDRAPEWLGAVLAELYACAALLANEVQTGLAGDLRFPLACPQPPAHVDRAVRLVLTDGARLPERSDGGDRATFPLRGCLALGPGAVEVAVVDLRPGKRRERVARVLPGAAAWFPARERPVRIGGVLGLQRTAYELRAGEGGALVLADWSDVVAR